MKHKISGQVKKDVLEYYNKGYTDRKIAGLIGDITHTTILNWRRKNILVANHKRWNRLEKEEIKAKRKEYD